MKNEETNPRRDFVKKSLAGTLALGAGMVFTGSLLSSLSAGAATSAAGEPVAHSEKAFRMGVIGPAELSLLTSQIAAQKAGNKNAKEFAGFELTEAIAVTTVLKDLGTP